MSDLPSPGDPLLALAQLRGVATGYIDMWGRRVEARRQALAGVLRALGEPVDGPGGAVAALEAHLRAAGASSPPPVDVIVAWDGRLPAGCSGVVELEDGPILELDATERQIPPGVHRLVPEGGGAGTGTTFVIAAPFRPPAFPAAAWGVFAPVYALHDHRRRDHRRGGHGDLTDLETLGRFVGSIGGSYVATLPLLATPAVADPSPYSPVSRLWWDDRHLDLRRLPEIAAEAAALPAGAGAGHPAAAGLLELGAARVAGAGTTRGDAFRRFVEDRPLLHEWSKFRSEQLEGSPARHRYAQWAMDEQLAEVAATMQGAGCSLLLDLPVGCRPDGFDPSAFPDSFARGATIGAPPDNFFVTGQDWGLAPLDPRGERAAGYPVLRAALANALRHAGALRIDHVMGLQRLWWIPQGSEAADGAYVAYPAEELLAIACLEASRAGAALVGEDLGTVEPELRLLLAAHGIGGTDVALFQLQDEPSRPLQARPGAMAMVDTHDTATLAGWLAGDDLALRRQLGVAGAGDDDAARTAAAAAIRDRLGASTVEDVLAALLEELGESPAGVVVATLEDLWGEREPQNVPGTSGEYANFSRLLARSLEQMEADPVVRSVLARLDRARRRAS